MQIVCGNATGMVKTYELHVLCRCLTASTCALMYTSGSAIRKSDFILDFWLNERIFSSGSCWYYTWQSKNYNVGNFWAILVDRTDLTTRFNHIFHKLHQLVYGRFDANNYFNILAQVNWKLLNCRKMLFNVTFSDKYQTLHDGICVAVIYARQNKSFWWQQLQIKLKFPTIWRIDWKPKLTHCNDKYKIVLNLFF